MLEPMRSPQWWLVIGLVLVAFGVLPIFPNGIRVAVVAVGALLALIAIARILGERTGDREHDPNSSPRGLGPGSGTGA